MSSFIEPLKYLACVLVGILGLGFLIGFHELGHFIFCKIFKIRTPSFSIGMGPKIFKKKIGDTEFSISALPLGGYVEISGLEEVGQGDQKESKRKDSLSFNQKPYYQKLLVLFGGILFNLFFAYAAFIFIYKAGMPKIGLLFPESQKVLVKSTISGSPAAKIGLQPGDVITGIMFQDGESFVNKSIISRPEFLDIIQKLPNKKVALFVQRGDQKLEFTADLAEEDGKGKIGVEFDQTESQDLPAKGWIESIKSGISSTNLLITKTISSFKNIFSKTGVKSVGGPLLIIKWTIKSAQKGPKMFFVLLSLISVNLAVLNLIPLPILDGGQVLFTTIESAMGRELNPKVKNIIHVACWFLVLGLMIILTLWDVKRMLV